MSSTVAARATPSPGTVPFNRSNDTVILSPEEQAQVERLLSERLVQGFCLLERACPACTTPLIKKSLPSPVAAAAHKDDSDDLPSLAAVKTDSSTESSSQTSTTSSSKDMTIAPGVAFCVKCQAHVVSEAAETELLDQFHSRQEKGHILVTIPTMTTLGTAATATPLRDSPVAGEPTVVQESNPAPFHPPPPLSAPKSLDISDPKLDCLSYQPEEFEVMLAATKTAATIDDDDKETLETEEPEEQDEPTTSVTTTDLVDHADLIKVSPKIPVVYDTKDGDDSSWQQQVWHMWHRHHRQQKQQPPKIAVPMPGVASSFLLPAQPKGIVVPGTSPIALSTSSTTVSTPPIPHLIVPAIPTPVHGNSTVHVVQPGLTVRSNTSSRRAKVQVEEIDIADGEDISLLGANTAPEDTVPVTNATGGYQPIRPVPSHETAVDMAIQRSMSLARSTASSRLSTPSMRLQAVPPAPERAAMAPVVAPMMATPPTMIDFPMPEFLVRRGVAIKVLAAKMVQGYKITEGAQCGDCRMPLMHLANQGSGALEQTECFVCCALRKQHFKSLAHPVVVPSSTPHSTATVTQPMQQERTLVAPPNGPVVNPVTVCVHGEDITLVSKPSETLSLSSKTSKPTAPGVDVVVVKPLTIVNEQPPSPLGVAATVSEAKTREMPLQTLVSSNDNVDMRTESETALQHEDAASVAPSLDAQSSVPSVPSLPSRVAVDPRPERNAVDPLPERNTGGTLTVLVGDIRDSIDPPSVRHQPSSFESPRPATSTSKTSIDESSPIEIEKREGLALVSSEEDKAANSEVKPEVLTGTGALENQAVEESAFRNMVAEEPSRAREPNLKAPSSTSDTARGSKQVESLKPVSMEVVEVESIPSHEVSVSPRRSASGKSEHASEVSSTSYTALQDGTGVDGILEEKVPATVAVGSDESSDALSSNKGSGFEVTLQDVLNKAREVPVVELSNSVEAEQGYAFQTQESHEVLDSSRSTRDIVDQPVGGYGTCAEVSVDKVSPCVSAVEDSAAEFPQDSVENQVRPSIPEPRPTELSYPAVDEDFIEQKRQSEQFEDMKAASIASSENDAVNHITVKGALEQFEDRKAAPIASSESDKVNLASSESDEVNRIAVKCKPLIVSNGGVHLVQGPSIAPTASELFQERWTILRAEARSIVTRRMLAGWEVLATQCQGAECNNFPLIKKDGEKRCVVCGGSGSGKDAVYEYSFSSHVTRMSGQSIEPSMDEAHENLELSPTKTKSADLKPVSIANNSALTLQSSFGVNSISSPTRVLSSYSFWSNRMVPSVMDSTASISPPTPTSAFGPSRDMVRMEIGRRLFDGWTLLDKTCPQCVMPVMTDKLKVHEICTVCGIVGKVNGPDTAAHVQGQLKSKPRDMAADGPKETPRSIFRRMGLSNQLESPRPASTGRPTQKMSGTRMMRLDSASVREQKGVNNEEGTPSASRSNHVSPTHQVSFSIDENKRRQQQSPVDRNARVLSEKEKFAQWVSAIDSEVRQPPLVSMREILSVAKEKAAQRLSESPEKRAKTAKRNTRKESEVSISSKARSTHREVRGGHVATTDPIDHVTVTSTVAVSNVLPASIARHEAAAFTDTKPAHQPKALPAGMEICMRSDEEKKTQFNPMQDSTVPGDTVNSEPRGATSKSTEAGSEPKAPKSPADTMADVWPWIYALKTNIAGAMKRGDPPTSSDAYSGRGVVRSMRPEPPECISLCHDSPRNDWIGHEQHDPSPSAAQKTFLEPLSRDTRKDTGFVKLEHKDPETTPLHLPEKKNTKASASDVISRIIQAAKTEPRHPITVNTNARSIVRRLPSPGLSVANLPHTLTSPASSTVSVSSRSRAAETDRETPEKAAEVARVQRSMSPRVHQEQLSVQLPEVPVPSYSSSSAPPDRNIRNSARGQYNDFSSSYSESPMIHQYTRLTQNDRTRVPSPGLSSAPIPVIKSSSSGADKPNGDNELTSDLTSGEAIDSPILSQNIQLSYSNPMDKMRAPSPGMSAATPIPVLETTPTDEDGEERSQSRSTFVDLSEVQEAAYTPESPSVDSHHTPTWQRMDHLRAPSPGHSAAPLPETYSSSSASVYSSGASSSANKSSLQNNRPRITPETANRSRQTSSSKSSKKPTLPGHLPGNPTRGRLPTRVKSSSVDVSKPKKIRAQINSDAHSESRLDHEPPVIDVELFRKSSRKWREGRDEVIIIGPGLDKRQNDADTLETLLLRIEKTKSQLAETSDDQDGVESQHKLRGLIDNLARAAEQMQQIDKS